MKISITYFLTSVLWISPFITKSQNHEHEEWKKERRAELLGENGWLNLAGLFWIDQEQSFLNEITKDSLAISKEPSKKAIGQFEIRTDSVWFLFSPKVTKKSKDKAPLSTLQFPLENYNQGGVYFDRWKWSVVKRGEQFAVRLRDLNHPALANFEPIPTYDYYSKWKLNAFFEPRFNQFISITNVLGQMIEWRVMGILKFEIEGKKQEIITLEDEGKLFVIFSDDTNGKATYPSGRYLHVDFPDKTGHTTIDFNYAYNPPCAFTAYATCPIPPKENRINFEIEAGEKEPSVH